MSIELTGPKGYDYQYLVTAFIALLHVGNNNSRLIVEKEGGEDAELTIFNGSEETTVEIQVKSTQVDLELQELTEWLSHFPDRSSENNLIDRMKNDNNRFALFITRARVLDILRPFLTDSISFNNNTFNNKLLDTIITHLKKNDGDEKGLKQRRVNHCIEQASYFESHKTILRNIIKRTLIWETMDEETLTSKCFDLMNKKYFVPYSKTANVLIKIIELVKVARNERGDVIPLIRQLLDRYNGERIYLNPINVERKGIEQLVEILDERNILLLTGISFSGKTHVARRIARHFQENGYNCLIASDLKEATRFLINTSVEERLCLIEDPFGQVELEDNYYELWSSLSDLISKLAPNRKIIVTSKIELLRRISNRDDPKSWTINECDWIDLTVNDHKFIRDVWDAYCLEKGVSPKVSKLVSEHLSESPKENLLQPGQLRHLAYQDELVLSQKSIDDLVELASVDAQTIGMYFNTKSNNFKKVLIILGIGASPRQSINTKELTYILSDSNSRPSIVILKENYTELRFPGNKTEPTFPNYDVATELPDWILEQLEDLENHGYITILGDNIIFSHPTYHEASKYLILRQNRIGLRLIDDILSKGLACIEPSTAFSFTKQLNKLFSNYSSNKDFQNALISQSSKALNSIFPSVRDTALIFLVTIIDHLDDKLQKVVYDFIKTEDIKNKRLLWQSGEPWIEISESYSFRDYISDLLSFRKERDVKKLAEKLIHPNESQTVTSEEAWQVVSEKFLFEEEDKNIRLITQLLSYKESFIRAKIAFTLVQRFSAGNIELVTQVFKDEHPNVIYQSIRGAISGWNNFSSENRVNLLTHMKKAMSDKVVSANASRFMIDFGDEYGADHIDRKNLSEIQKSELWKIWSKLFPLFFQAIPEKFVSIDESHLFNTIINSVNYIESDEIINIAEAWLAWIERNIPIRLLHESGYAIADFLLRKTEAEDRRYLSERILNQLDTNFITVALAEYINRWDILSEWEKEKIELLLNSEREDVRWLRAVCLTRTHVPTKISSVLLGYKNQNIFKEDVTKIIETFPPELLTDCLRVYIGEPQPLWWLGYHHASGTIWPQILIKLLEMPDHSGFVVALTNFIEKFIYRNFKGDITTKVLQLWKNLVISGNESIIKLLFEKLEIKCINFNGPDIKDLWKIFFDNIDVEKKAYYLKKIIDEVEAYTYFNELHEIFENEFFEKDIFPKLPVDFLIFKLIITYQKIMKGMDDKLQIIQNLYSVVLKIYSSELPRLEVTNRIVKKFFKDFEEDKSELILYIEKSNNQIKDIGRKRKDNFNEHDDIQNWVSLYLQN